MGKRKQRTLLSESEMRRFSKLAGNEKYVDEKIDDDEDQLDEDKVGAPFPSSQGDHDWTQAPKGPTPGTESETGEKSREGSKRKSTGQKELNEVDDEGEMPFGDEEEEMGSAEEMPPEGDMGMDDEMPPVEEPADEGGVSETDVRGLVDAIADAIAAETGIEVEVEGGEVEGGDVEGEMDMEPEGDMDYEDEGDLEGGEMGYEEEPEENPLAGLDENALIEEVTKRVAKRLVMENRKAKKRLAEAKRKKQKRAQKR